MFMSDILKALAAEWAGAPLLIWLGGILVVSILALRFKKFRFHFKGREREIDVEANK
jgi:hypothetical protein